MANFGPFYDRKTITFGSDGTGVHLIRGKNGSGKSSIQRSVLWCLYGEVKDRNGRTIPPTSLLNKTAFERDEYDFFVNLTFNHEGKNWIMHRRMRAHSHNEREYINNMKSTLTVDGESVPNPDQTIQRLIPQNVSKFFFFDGEMLGDYEDLLYESVDNGLLRDSIERVLGIPYLKTAKEDIKVVQRKIERQKTQMLRRLGGDSIEQIIHDYEDVGKQIEQEETSLKALEDQASLLETQLIALKHDLMKVESVKKLSVERNQLEADIKAFNAEKDKQLIRLNQETSQLYKVILSSTAKNLVSTLKMKHDKVMAKYDRKQKLLANKDQITKGISDQKCRLCGTVLNEEKLEELKSQLTEINAEIELLTEIPEPNLEFEAYSQSLKKMLNYSEKRETLKEIDEKIIKIDHDLAVSQSRLSGIKDSLIGQNEEEPKRIEIQIRNAENEKGRLRGLIDTQKQNIEEFEKLKSELNQKIASIDQEEIKILTRRTVATEALSKILEKAIAVYREQRKREVEKYATEIFREIKSKGDFDKLQINDQYGLNILTNKGRILDKGELRSAGEEQIVALSLIGSLNKCAKINAPVFMDSPFIRLDVEHSEKVLTFIPRLAEEVTLLVTDKEFRPGDESFLQESIKSDYTVKHINQERGSEIYYTEKGDK